MATPAQVAATTKYIKTHMRQYVIRCNNERDADIIAYLDKTENVTALIKELIRQRITEEDRN